MYFILWFQVPVSLLTSSLLLASSTGQDVPSVPGLQAWRQAQSQVIEAERRLTGSEAAPDPVTPGAGRVPGLQQWRAHQAAALQAERQLEAGEAGTERTEVTITEAPTSPGSPALAPGKQAAGLNELRSLLQTSIKKFLSKTKQKTKERKEEKLTTEKSSKIFSLLSSSIKSTKKATSQASYLDQLIKSYKSDSSERDNVVRDFDFLHEEAPRSRGPLSRLEYFDDPYVSRSRSLYQEDIEEALIESELLDRELKKMLRKLQFDY